MPKKEKRLQSDPMEDEPLSWIGKKKDSKQSKRSKQSKPSTEKGLKDGWKRATLIVRKENLKKIKAVAYWERKNIKEVVDEALNNYLSDKNPDPIEKN